ncbi:MAG: hypothetical protein IJA23_04180, partial [Clostridia bacterium]|nr:hypothetical protein [Clostridia bacterium]
VAKEYTIKFYYSHYDYNSMYHGTSHLDTALTGQYDEYFKVNTNYSLFKEITVTFNTTLEVDYATYNLNFNNVSGDGTKHYTPYGYDFYYWIFSREAVSGSKIYDVPIYGSGRTFYNDEDCTNLISTHPSSYVYENFGYLANTTTKAGQASYYAVDNTKSTNAISSSAVKANYIYDLYSATTGNNMFVKYFDLYDQDTYNFYAYYRKEIYDYYYYYAKTDGVADATSNANANLTSNYVVKDVDYNGVQNKVKYDNVITLTKLYNNALPTNYTFVGWYPSIEPFDKQIFVEYGTNTEVLGYYYMNDDNSKVYIDHVNGPYEVYRENTRYGEYVGSPSYYNGYPHSQIGYYDYTSENRKLYFYAVYRLVINKYNLDITADDKASTISNVTDEINNGIDGYLKDLFYDGTTSNGLHVTNIQIVYDSYYNNDIYIANSEVRGADSIHSMQNRTLEIRFTTKRGYRLLSYDLLNESGESIMNKNITIYSKNGENHIEVCSNKLTFTETEVSNGIYTYVIRFENAYNDVTTSYSTDAHAYSDEISTIDLDFYTLTYEFLDYSEEGSTNASAQGFTYIPAELEETSANHDLTTNYKFDITARDPKQLIYFGNTNAIVFYPKYDRLATSNEGTDLYEISSYLRKLQIGSTTYTFSLGINPTTHRFDLTQTTILS